MLPIHRQVYLLAYLQEGWAKMRWVFYELLTVPWTCPWRPNQPKSYFHKKSLPQDLIRKILALAAAISLLFQQRRWAATFTHEPRRQEAYYQTKQQVWLENSKLFDHFRLNLNGVIFFFIILFKLKPSGLCPSANLSTTHKPHRQEANYKTKLQVWLKNSMLFDDIRLNLNGVIFF